MAPADGPYDVRAAARRIGDDDRRRQRRIEHEQLSLADVVDQQRAVGQLPHGGDGAERLLGRCVRRGDETHGGRLLRGERRDGGERAGRQRDAWMSAEKGGVNVAVGRVTLTACRSG